MVRTLIGNKIALDTWQEVLAALPSETGALKVYLYAAAEENVSADPGQEAVVQLSFALGDRTIRGAVKRFAVQSGSVQKVLLESCIQLTPEINEIPFSLSRLSEDPADTFPGDIFVEKIEFHPIGKPAAGQVIPTENGYNSWPMCQTLGNMIVCTYSRGLQHDICEPFRNTYARVSRDGGKTWEEETLVVDTPSRGDVPVGKGLDEEGNMLLWVRHSGGFDHEQKLFRTRDGKNFECIVDRELFPRAVQITDIFHVPGKGLMALWFGGVYHKDGENSWGTLVSSDNGMTWIQKTVQTGLSRAAWPTEPSAVYLGEGRILAIARTEFGGNTTEKAQFQLQSTDYGDTWSVARTNITDICISTPSLILDRENNMLYNYYFYRGRGLLQCRKNTVDQVWDHPLAWAEPQTVLTGSSQSLESGNVNTTLLQGKHVLAYYSGALPHTDIMIALREKE